MSNQQPQIHNIAKAKDCQLYKPGHQVHWIQARVKAEKPKFDARVKKVDETSVEISWLGTTKRFQHHDVPRLIGTVGRAVDGNIQFSPEADLLYVQTESANKLHGGAFALFYLSEEDLSPCQFQSTTPWP